MKVIPMYSIAVLLMLVRPTPLFAWTFVRDEGNCIAETGGVTGITRVTLIQYAVSKDSFSVIISSPSWNLKEGQRKRLMLNYVNNRPDSGNGNDSETLAIPPPLPLDALSVEFVAPGSSSPGLQMLIDRQLLDKWSEYSERGLGMQFMYEGKDISGMMEVGRDVKAHLDTCRSP